MSIVPINIGGQANDGNGQTLRSGGALINANFAELDTRTTTAQETAGQGVADAAAALDAAVTAQAKADEAVPSSAVGVTVAQLVEGLVPASQLPSYVDDVLEYPTLGDFPAVGETGKIYIAINDGDSPSNPTRQYRWSGTAYVMIPSSPGSTDQVPEGSINLYHTAARVRTTPLTGLSTSLNEAVVATDSVLSGIGKLQAQISAAVTALAGKLDKSGGKLTGALNHANIVALASSATPAIGAAAANTVTITGTTAITGFDSIASGAVRTLVFAGAVTLTHNPTSLILPKGADITTAAGDVLQFTSLGGGNWRCTGAMVASSGGSTAWGSITGTLSAQTDLQTALTSLGNRATALEALNAARTWQDMTTGRALTTTYTNTDPCEREINVSLSSTTSGQLGITPTVGTVTQGATIMAVAATGFMVNRTFTVSPGGNYSISGVPSSATPNIAKWTERKL